MRQAARGYRKLNYGRTLNYARQVSEGVCGVRYGRERKQATRRRIIETAGRRFKADGIDGSGIAAVGKRSMRSVSRGRGY